LKRFILTVACRLKVDISVRRNLPKRTSNKKIKKKNTIYSKVENETDEASTLYTQETVKRDYKVLSQTILTVLLLIVICTKNVISFHLRYF